MLPLEIIDVILFKLPYTNVFATYLQREYVQDYSALTFLGVDRLCARGIIRPLDLLFYSTDLSWDENVMDSASRHGHVAVLEWWAKSGLECKWSDNTMDLASMNGHVPVLEWWLASGLKCKWSDFAINWAALNGHVDVLEWWLASGLKCKWYFLEKCLKTDSGKENVREWYSASGLGTSV